MAPSSDASPLKLLYVAYLIGQWIFFSSSIILFNKHILSDLHFPYPATLVMFHMLFASAFTSLGSLTGYLEIPKLELKVWASQVLPVGLCFAVSLVLGNAAYLYISVAFVQMLKASTPVAVLLCSFAFQLEKPTFTLAGFILLISTGIATSCLNEIQISVPGVAIQMGAVAAEALRLCLINMLMTSRGLKLSPFGTLYYVAPACAMCLLLPWIYMEGVPLAHHQFMPVRKVGAAILLSNASIVVCLNLATMALIKKTSALTLNVAGVFKDIGLILWSVFVSGAVVSKLQYVGYAIALVGVTGYSQYKRITAAATEGNSPKVAAMEVGGRGQEVEPICSKTGESETTPTAR